MAASPVWSGTGSWSSMLCSRCRKLLSFTGDPLCPDDCCPCPLPTPPAPLPLFPGLGELKCGMFSGRGCCEPIEVTPTSDALPALERA